MASCTTASMPASLRTGTYACLVHWVLTWAPYMAPEAFTTSSTRLRSLSSCGVVKALMVPVMLVLSAWMLGDPWPAAEGRRLLQGSPQLWCSKGGHPACGSALSA